MGATSTKPIKRRTYSANSFINFTGKIFPGALHSADDVSVCPGWRFGRKMRCACVCEIDVVVVMMEIARVVRKGTIVGCARS